MQRLFGTMRNFVDVSSGDVRRWVTVSISSVLSGKPTFNTWTTGRQLKTHKQGSASNKHPEARLDSSLLPPDAMS